AKLTHEFRDMREEALKLGRADLLPLIGQMEQLQKTAGAFFDVFAAFKTAFDDIAQALVAGTLTMKKVFDSLKTSIIKSFVDAFAEGFKAKLGFEGNFKVNIVQFVKNIGGVLTGGNGEGKGLFGGVFQGSGPGGKVDGFLGGILDTLGIPSGITGGGVSQGQQDAIRGQLLADELHQRAAIAHYEAAQATNVA